MSEPQPPNPQEPEPPEQPPEQGPESPWPPPGTGRWMLLTSLVGIAILLVQLYPYQFTRSAGSLYALHYGDYLSVLGQVALFVPLGFVETQLARRLLTGAGAVLVLLVTLDGLLLSLVCETAQFWLPTRTSSAVDIVANALGTVVGYKLALLLIPSRYPS